MALEVGDCVLVILAAGRSTRMGMPKGLVEVEGRPLLARHVDSFYAAGGRRIVVVVESDAHPYDALLRAEANRQDIAITAVASVAPADGPFASVQTALLTLRDEAWRGILVAPVDTLAATASTLVALVRAMNAGVQVVKPAYGGRGGHPLLVSRAATVDWSTLPAADSRLDHLVAAFPSETCRYVDVQDRGVLSNLNSPADIGPTKFPG